MDSILLSNLLFLMYIKYGANDNMRKYFKWFLLASIIIILLLVAAFAPTFIAPIVRQVSPLTLLSPVEQITATAYVYMPLIICHDCPTAEPTATYTATPRQPPPGDTDTPTPTITATLRPVP